MAISKLKASSIASGTIDNARISLDAAEIPALPTSKITSGTFDDARIAASNVSQHATSFDDNKLVNDLSTLGLRVHTQENLSASNTNSQYVDVFQDNTGITNLTNVSNVSEYLASVYSIKTQFIPSLHRTSTHTGSLQNASWTGSGNTANSWLTAGGSEYTGTFINELWDLTNDFQCRMFYGNNGGSGALETTQYPAMSVYISTDTSISAGSDPDIFAAASAHTFYGNSATATWNGSNLLTSTAKTAFATASTIYSNFDTNANGAGAKSQDASNGNLLSYGYYNDTNAWGGFQVVYDQSASTIVYQPLSWDGSAIGFPSNGITTVSNVPSTGRVIIAFGEAYNTARAFQTSYLNGNVANDDFSYKFSASSNATGSFESNAITAPSSTTKMGAVITYQDNAGTNALNTDIVLQLSADGGSNYSTATMTALPDFSTGIKMAKVNDLAVTSGTSLKYKISFANQASGSKEARIRGVSLNY